MTKREAATILVDMACTIRDKGNLTFVEKQKLNEAIAIACGELMVDEVLNDKAKTDEEEGE